MKENVIDIKDLTVHFQSREIGVCKAVNHFSLSIKRGETIGLVGETGAGKTTVALSIMRLLQMPPAVIKSGEILYEGQDVLKFSKKQMREFRGKKVSMIFQDPMTALNPIETIGDQVSEVIRIHNKVDKKTAMEMAVKMLERKPDCWGNRSLMQFRLWSDPFPPVPAMHVQTGCSADNLYS